MYYYPEEQALCDEDEIVDKAGDINKENTNVIEFCNFIADQQPENTKQKMRYDLQTWYGFSGKKNKLRNVEDISFVKLNLLLCSFFKDVKKKNGKSTNPQLLRLFNKTFIDSAFTSMPFRLNSKFAERRCV